MRRSRLSKGILCKHIEHFVAGTPARSAAKICNSNYKTAIAWYHKVRIILSEHLSRYNMELDGEIEADESYFEGSKKGRRGCGAAGKIIVFELYKRIGYIYTASIVIQRAAHYRT